MSENQDDNTAVEALKAKIQELEVENASLTEENEKLKDALTKASGALEEEVAKQKKTHIDAVLAATDMEEDELKDLDLKQLKLLHKAVTSIKSLEGEGDEGQDSGTVKNIRRAAGAGDKPNNLTVGCLYHKGQEAED